MTSSWALLFGAAIILFFSYDRFNVASFDGKGGLERLITLLTPDKLRARGVFVRAYLSYAAMLLTIYLFMCAYAEVLPLFGASVPGIDKLGGAKQIPDVSPSKAPEFTVGYGPLDESPVQAWRGEPQSATEAGAKVQKDAQNNGVRASVALAVALILVGFAPTFPLLKRFDEWMRSTAHKLAGIPTWVVAAKDNLQTYRLEIPVVQNSDGTAKGLLISQADWQEFENIRTMPPFQKDEDLRNDLELILGISSWVLDGQIALENDGMRYNFKEIEKTLKQRKELLFLQLAKLANSTPDAELTLRAERNTRDLASDMRIVVALYQQHGILGRKATTNAVANCDEPEIAASAAAQAEKTQESKIRSMERAERILCDYVGHVAETLEKPSLTRETAPVAMWTFGIALAATMLWAIYLGNFEAQLQHNGEFINVYQRLFEYNLVSLTAFFVTALTALVIRDALSDSLNDWQNPWAPGTHWTQWLPQYALILASCFIVATTLSAGYVLWSNAARVGWEDLRTSSLAANFGRILPYQAPTALRGAVLAAIVVALLDWQRSRTERPQLKPISGKGRSTSNMRASLCWAAGAAVVMAIVGAATRWLTYWAGRRTEGSGLLRPFDQIDMGLLIYASLFSAIMGALVVFLVSEMNFHRVIQHGRAEAQPRGGALQPSQQQP